MRKKEAISKREGGGEGGINTTTTIYKYNGCREHCSLTLKSTHVYTLLQQLQLVLHKGKVVQLAAQMGHSMNWFHSYIKGFFVLAYIKLRPFNWFIFINI